MAVLSPSRQELALKCRTGRECCPIVPHGEPHLLESLADGRVRKMDRKWKCTSVSAVGARGGAAVKRAAVAVLRVHDSSSQRVPCPAEKLLSGDHTTMRGPYRALSNVISERVHV